MDKWKNITCLQLFMSVYDSLPQPVFPTLCHLPKVLLYGSSPDNLMLYEVTYVDYADFTLFKFPKHIGMWIICEGNLIALLTFVYFQICITIYSFMAALLQVKY